MAGISKAERERRAAEAGVVLADESLATMYREEPEFEGGPTSADVHADEVSAWKEHGWRVKE